MIDVRLWGTRGSLAAPGAATARYGGNTACVEVRGPDRSVLILDAGSGIRDLGSTLEAADCRVDVLLSHLHMDHIQGLGFFGPLFDSSREVHLWGPMSTTHTLRSRLARYLSPPLFPVYLRDLPWLHLHDVADMEFEIGPFHVTARHIFHPDTTVGYRVATPSAALAYLPDHEPALGLPIDAAYAADYTSGYDLAKGVDLLIHDAQYTADEYATRVGWGHSTISQALEFGRLCGVGRLVLFHHNPAHTDDDLDRLIDDAIGRAAPPFPVTGGVEGATVSLVATRSAVRRG